MTPKSLLSIVAAFLSLVAPVTAFAQESPNMSQLPTPNESGFADVNNIKLWYQTYGEGDPLILIHGGFGSVEMFGPNIEMLAKHHKVIGVDLQAHGGTGPLGRPMTFEAMATDIAELIKSMGYEKADVMGYSLGAITSLRLAIDHPEVVDRMVVISGVYAISNWHDYNFNGMKGIAADPDGTADSMVGSPMHEGYAAKAPGGAESWKAAVREVGGLIGTDFDWSAEIPTIAVPMLVIVGDWDSVRIGAATKLFELLGGGAQDANWDRSGMGQNHFAVIPNATHYDIIDTTAVSDAALPFLDGYPQPPNM